MADLFKPVGPDADGAKLSLFARLGWFIGIALASGGVVLAAAYLLRGLLFI